MTELVDYRVKSDTGKHFWGKIIGKIIRALGHFPFYPKIQAHILRTHANNEAKYLKLDTKKYEF